jgi:GTPase SAR1 family protein
MTKMMIIGDNAFKFNIWDTAGQERVNYMYKYIYTNKLL